MDDTRQHDDYDPSVPQTAPPEAPRPPIESERCPLVNKSAEQDLDATTPAIQEGEMVSIEYKHSLATRWMHWINFPLLFLMIYSGILIYWADSQHEGLHAHQVYRIGVGNWTIFRFFPQWLYNTFHLKFQLAQGLAYHFFFMWFFALNGLAYVGYTLASREWRNLVPTRDSLKGAVDVVFHDLDLSKRPLPEQKFNHAQRIAYTGVVLMGAASLLAGLAIYKPSQLHVLTSLLGGYEMARWFHFCLTLSYVGFFIVHVAQVIRAGWNNFRSIITGYQIVPADSVQKEASDEQDSRAS